MSDVLPRRGKRKLPLTDRENGHGGKSCDQGKKDGTGASKERKGEARPVPLYEGESARSMVALLQMKTSVGETSSLGRRKRRHPPILSQKKLRRGPLTSRRGAKGMLTISLIRDPRGRPLGRGKKKEGSCVGAKRKKLATSHPKKAGLGVWTEKSRKGSLRTILRKKRGRN